MNELKAADLQSGGSAQWLLPDAPELVKSVTNRCEKVALMAGMKIELELNAGVHDLEQVTAVYNKANGHGLDVPETWMLTGGADCWNAVAERKAELEKEKELSAESIAGFTSKLEACMTSTDHLFIKGWLDRAAVHC